MPEDSGMISKAFQWLTGGGGGGAKGRPGSMYDMSPTPLSQVLDEFLQTEATYLDDDPLIDADPDSSRDPFDSNQAIPTLLFKRHRARFEHAFPGLSLAELRYLGLWAYPLSGGFQSWSLVPAAAVGPLLRLEDRLAGIVGPFFAFRLMAVVEKR